jgi:hypothetical protein
MARSVKSGSSRASKASRNAVAAAAESGHADAAAADDAKGLAGILSGDGEDDDSDPGEQDESEAEDQVGLQGIHGASEVCVPCWANCATEEGTVNISTGSKLGCFLGPQCYAAFRGFRAHCKQAKCLPQMNTFKRKHPEAFKKRIIGLRILDADSLVQGNPGCATYDERRGKMSEFVDETHSFSTVQNKDEVFWLLKHEYIAHLKFFKNFPNDQAALDQWKVDHANVDVLRRGEGENVRLAVYGIPKTQGLNGTTQAPRCNLYFNVFSYAHRLNTT